MKHAISLADDEIHDLTTKLRTNGFSPFVSGPTSIGSPYGIYQRVGAVVMFTAIFPTGYTGSGIMYLPIKMDSKFLGCGQASVSGYYTPWGAFNNQTMLAGLYVAHYVYLPDPAGFTNYTAGGAIQVSGWYIAG